MAEEKKCASCGMVITEETKCSCDPTKCCKCCECDEDCSCGCKKCDCNKEEEKDAE